MSENKSYANRYGKNTKEILKKLHRDASDPFKPAVECEKLTGEGNCRNGAAMRVAPVALYYAQNKQKMLEVR